MDTGEGKTVRRLICLTLMLVTMATFCKVVQNDFINFDDPAYVTENPEVNHGLTLAGVTWAFTHYHAGNWHPLTWISLMLDCQLFGLNAGPQHLVNVLFHAANAALLFLLWHRMTGALRRSAVVAALFALHPLHVESVAWISERKDVLSTFFGLLSLLAYHRLVSESGVQSPKSKVWLAGALILFALGLMAKPMLVTLPLVMLLLDFWPLQRISCFKVATSNPLEAQRPTRCSNLKTCLWEKWPFFALTLVSCAITYQAQRSGGAIEPLAHYSVESRVSNALVAYLHYIGKMIWPVKLAIMYPLSFIPAWQAAGAGVILLVLSILCVAAARRRPYLLTGWFWYLGTLVPVIGLVQVGRQSFADRYTYLPLVGLFVMVVWGAADLIARWKYRNGIAGVAAAVALLLCAADSAFQIQFWKTNLILFDHAVSVTTGNALAQNNLAAALAAAGRTQEAFSHYAEAARLNPNDALMQNNFGVALAREGMTDEAIARYRQAIQMDPNYADAYNNLGAALTGQEKFAEAVSNLSQAVALNPDHAEAYNNLGRALALQGKQSEAAAQYREAIHLVPRNDVFHLNLGLSLLKSGRPDEAVDEFAAAALLNPRSPDAQYELGYCLAMLRRPEIAVAHLREAVRLRPDWAEPLNALAWVLATDSNAQIRDGAEAVRLAEKAVALSQGRQPVVLNTLAAAFAEAGRFDDATNAAANAAELARQSGRINLAAQIQSALELYQQHRAYRQP